MRSLAASFLLVLASAAVAMADDASEARLERLSYVSTSGETKEYFAYLPRGYHSDADRSWPLMLFLHGNGERGNGREDLEWVLVHGPLYEAWIQKRDLPFIILSPQLPLFGLDETVPYIRDRQPQDIPVRLEEGVPPRQADFETTGPIVGAAASDELPHGPEGPPHGWMTREQDLLTILDQAAERFRVDPQRVYLTGLSYGGFGTWALSSRHPQRFAAIAPVVGWGHPELMPPLAERLMPIWVIAGGRDASVPAQYFFAGVNELERLGHESVRLTVHEDAGHDVWKRVYAGRDLYDWLLSHTLAD